MKKIIVQVPDRHCGKYYKVDGTYRVFCFAMIFLGRNLEADGFYCEAFPQGLQKLRTNNSGRVLRCKLCYKAEKKCQM